MSEGDVIKACIQWLCLHGCDIIRNNTGRFNAVYKRKDGTTGNYHIRAGKKGSGDIIACSPHGKWVEIECKFGDNKQQPEQIARQHEIERRKGIYIVAYSTDELERRKAEIIGE